MPGMLTDEQLDDLEAARGAEFRTLWLEMMIEHHEGALEMAATAASDGEFADTVAMAEVDPVLPAGRDRPHADLLDS